MVLWFTIAGAFASALALVLALNNWSSQRLESGRVRWRTLIPSVALPYSVVVYVAVTFVIYAVWCERVRGVDAGVGEYHYVPLANGYTLEIVATGRAFVEDPEGQRLPLRFDRLGAFQHLVFGRLAPAEFFILDTQTGEITTYASEDALPSALQLPRELYHELRWGSPDILAALLVISVPAMVIGIWRRR